jgi:hypothetical protein
MKNTILCGALAAAASIMAGHPAAAQVAGTYSGSSADGSGVSFTVATDPSNGDLAITSAVIFYGAPCKASTVTNYGGWGYGLNADIVNGVTSNNTYTPNFDITFSLKFSADGQTATGDITTLIGILDTDETPPKKSLFCESKKQKMSVSLQSGDAKLPALTGHYLYDRRGHVIGQIAR